MSPLSFKRFRFARLSRAQNCSYSPVPGVIADNCVAAGAVSPCTRRDSPRRFY